MRWCLLKPELPGVLFAKDLIELTTSRLSMGSLLVFGSLMCAMLIFHLGVILSAFSLSVASTLASVSWQS